MNRFKKMKLLWSLFFTFMKISPFSFGGGYAMIPLLERAVTEKKKWAKKEEITDVLVMAQTVPGSIAVNTATFIGYRLAGLSGAVVGTLGIVIPTFIIIVLLAALFLNFQHNPIVAAALMGIRPAIVALIIYTAIKIGKTAIFDIKTLIFAVISLILFLFVHMHPIVILVAGGLGGILLNMKKLISTNEKDREKSRGA
ncbi:chromate transporter [Neobacillus mesonae]|uniref:chromate transporter n=1 Tax=Neobacillus mesonae TaxID=1193713 RepID=UPI002E212AD8|nr:chromate transporter [Neobacillus mesonae]